MKFYFIYIYIGFSVLVKAQNSASSVFTDVVVTEDLKDIILFSEQGEGISKGNEENNYNDVDLYSEAQRQKELNLAIEWYRLILKLTQNTPGYTPTTASRTFAYISLAFYEAIITKKDQYTSFSTTLSELKRSKHLDRDELNKACAANAAIGFMVEKLFEGASARWQLEFFELRKKNDSYFKTILSKELFEASKTHGEAIAEWIYEYSKNDGGDRSYIKSFNLNYEPPKCDSCWEFKPPAPSVIAHYNITNSNNNRVNGFFPLHPYWGENRLFIEQNRNLKTSIDIHFSTDSNSTFYKQAYETYDFVNKIRKGQMQKEYTTIAQWDDSTSDSYTPPGHSVFILTDILEKENKSLLESAYSYTLLSVALSDAFVVAWREKYRHNLVRPITYIEKYIDPSWKPFLQTPVFPEFPSGHAVQIGTMVAVMNHLYGENYSFEDKTYPNYVSNENSLKFNNFESAGIECYMSRVYAGIHFREACEKGFLLGKMIGNQVVEKCK